MDIADPLVVRPVDMSCTAAKFSAALRGELGLRAASARMRGSASGPKAARDCVQVNSDMHDACQRAKYGLNPVSRAGKLVKHPGGF